ncbi:MAG: 4-hydroxybenzoate 3-monooxygenase [Thermoleophilia bacterium]
MAELTTDVAIIGAGPAGLALARMLEIQGVDALVLERSSREHVRTRQRAGLIEAPTRDVLVEIGAGERLLAAGGAHRGFYLRHEGVTHHLDLAALVGRMPVHYPQTEIVSDLIDVREADGAPLRFDAEVVGIEGHDAAPGPALAGRPVRLVARGAHGTLRVAARCVAACDGFHGIGRRLLLSGLRGATIVGREYPFAWLGILARTTPDPGEGMYCVSPRGMSLHSLRGPRVTRQYLQVPRDTDLADWPDERIWSELRLRSRSCDHAELEVGEIFERSLFPLRSAVVEPMQWGRLFLVGDAAHIVPPTGAKGLNLAVSDASALAYSIASALRGGAGELSLYGERASTRVWEAQLFSWSMTTLLHTFDDDPFSWRVKCAQLRTLIGSLDAQRALGEIYVGTPFPVHWREGPVSGAPGAPRSLAGR